MFASSSKGVVQSATAIPPGYLVAVNPPLCSFRNGGAGIRDFKAGVEANGGWFLEGSNKSTNTDIGCTYACVTAANFI